MTTTVVPQFITNKGVPVLAAETFYGSDTWGEIVAKVKSHLRVGFAVVLVLDPDFRTVTVYRHNFGPVMFNDDQHLSCEPHLPGFKVAVAELFEG